MKIIVAGGTGFIGEPLVRHLVARGDEVVVLSRNPSKVSAGRGVQWDGKSSGAWSREVGDADAIVNLAGESIADGRWTAARKAQLLNSRIDATKALIEALSDAPERSRAMVNASAIGFYGDRGEQVLDETSTRGQGFLADLVVHWETAARRAEGLARLSILRFGIVLAAEGGALGKMILPFKLGAGGPIGNGQQWMSWIDREDVLRLIAWALDTQSARGVYNATAPEPVRNREFARELGRALHRPAIIPTPPFALRLALGEMADELLIAGQRVLPSHAEAEGFRFGTVSISAALAKAVK
jgi:uncharacterized protein